MTVAVISGKSSTAAQVAEVEVEVEATAAVGVGVEVEAMAAVGVEVKVEAMVEAVGVDVKIEAMVAAVRVEVAAALAIVVVVAVVVIGVGMAVAVVVGMVIATAGTLSPPLSLSLSLDLAVAFHSVTAEAHVPMSSLIGNVSVIVVTVVDVEMLLDSIVPRAADGTKSPSWRTGDTDIGDTGVGVTLALECGYDERGMAMGQLAANQ